MKSIIATIGIAIISFILLYVPAGTLSLNSIELFENSYAQVDTTGQDHIKTNNRGDNSTLLKGTIYHFTNNNTMPTGTWLISGTWQVKILDNRTANFVADIIQVKVGNDDNTNVPYDERAEHSHHISNFETDSIFINNKGISINGTADNIQNGLMRFENIPISITILGGKDLPYSHILVKQGGNATNFANGATPWFGVVNQNID